MINATKRFPWRISNSVRARFTFGVMLTMLPLLVLAAVSFYALERVNRAHAETIAEVVSEVEPLGRLETSILSVALPLHDYLILGDTRERNSFKRLSDNVDREFKQVKATDFKSRERAPLRSAAGRWRAIKTESRHIMMTDEPVGNPVLASKMKRVDNLIGKTMAELRGAHEIADRELIEHLSSGRRAERQAIIIIAIALVVGLGGTLVIGIRLAGSILKPLAALTESAGFFAAGELSHRAPRLASDEIGQFGEAFNFMASMLEEHQGELEKSRSRLKKLAITDGLTGLFNHAEFHNLLEEETKRWQRYGAPVSLLFLDIDHFKRVNDDFGHQAGDRVLAGLAQFIQAAIRPIDKACRYGGEEFTIILPETDKSGVLTTADRLLNGIASKAIAHEGPVTINITVSIGIAALPADAHTKEELIAQADHALYVAKQTGRKRVVAA